MNGGGAAVAAGWWAASAGSGRHQPVLVARRLRKSESKASPHRKLNIS